MSTATISARHTREGIFSDLLGILENMTSDWDLAYDGGVEEQTRLIVDLGFESIDVVQLVVAIEEHFRRRDLPFMELLMAEGRYVDELTVGDTVEFLARHLGAA